MVGGYGYPLFGHPYEEAICGVAGEGSADGESKMGSAGGAFAGVKTNGNESVSVEAVSANGNVIVKTFPPF